MIMDKGSKILYYDSLEVEDKDRYFPRTVYEVEIEVDDEDILDHIWEYVQEDKEEMNKLASEYNGDIEKYLDANYDDLFDKYYDKLLDQFEERALDKVYRNWDRYVENYDETHAVKQEKKSKMELTEKDWKFQMPLEVAKRLRNAIDKDNMEEDDYIELQQALVDAWKSLADIGALDEDEVEDEIDEVNILSTSVMDYDYNDDFDYDDYDYQDYEDALDAQEQMEQDWNYALSHFYDICDYEGIWIPTEVQYKEEFEESLDEDIVKQDGYWVNKGKEGTHGKFKTKKAAEAQMRAMYANGFKESIEPKINKEDIEAEVHQFSDKWNVADGSFVYEDKYIVEFDLTNIWVDLINPGDKKHPIPLEHWRFKLEENLNEETSDTFDIKVDNSAKEWIEHYSSKEDADERYEELLKLKEKPSMRGLVVEKLYSDEKIDESLEDEETDDDFSLGKVSESFLATFKEPENQPPTQEESSSNVISEAVDPNMAYDDIQ